MNPWLGTVVCMRLPCRGGSLSPGPAPACGRDPQEGGGQEKFHVWETAGFSECHQGSCGQGSKYWGKTSPLERGIRSRSGQAGSTGRLSRPKPSSSRICCSLPERTLSLENDFGPRSLQASLTLSLCLPRVAFQAGCLGSRCFRQ